MRRSPHILSPVAILCVVLGCGSTVAEELDAEQLIRVRPEPPGDRCPSGGEVVMIGFDLDGDGVLSDAEIEHVEYYCDDDCSPPEGVLIIETEADWTDLIESGCRVLSGSLRLGLIGVGGLEAVSSVVRIDGDLIIEGNDELESLGGFDHLTEVTGRISISDNPSLENLHGLDSLTLVRGGLVIHHNAALVDLEGLGLLSRVGGRLVIKNNASLESLAGLGPTTSVGSFVRISENPSLTCLGGLGHLASIGSDLRIDRNPMLESLVFLLALRSLGGDLFILDNTALPECEAYSLIDRLAEDGWSNDALVEGNDAQAICD